MLWQAIAVGVNCTSPQFITPLVRTARAECGDRAIVVYPNSGEEWDGEKHRWKPGTDQQLRAFEAQTKEWCALLTS